MDTDANMRQDQTDTLAERKSSTPRIPLPLARPPHFVRLANVLPALREHCDRRMQPVDAAYEAVASSNAPCRVFESEAANLPSNS